MATEKPEKILRGEAVWPSEPPQFGPMPPMVTSSRLPSWRQSPSQLSPSKLLTHWPRRLLIPIGAGQGNSSETGTSGELLKRGAPLTKSPMSPVAPSNGRTGEFITVTLTSGKTTRAIEFFPETPASDDPEKAEPDIPSSLDKLIDLLRPMGVIDRRDAPELLNQLHEAKSRPVDTVICSVLDTDCHSAHQRRTGAAPRWRHG